MNKYTITIYETLSKAVDIEAEDYPHALKKVKEKYYNGEIVLTADDHYDTDFDCMKV